MLSYRSPTGECWFVLYERTLIQHATRRSYAYKSEYEIMKILKIRHRIHFAERFLWNSGAEQATIWHRFARPLARPPICLDSCRDPGTAAKREQRPFR